MLVIPRPVLYHGQSPERIWFQSLENILQDGLGFLLCYASWKVKVFVEEEGLAVGAIADSIRASDVREDDFQRLLTQRNRLIEICEKCFERALTKGGNVPDADVAPREAEFLSSVSPFAYHVACDLRSLFPKEWLTATSHHLQALAISNEGKLIGGSVRCLRSKEDDIRTSGDREKDVILEFLLPLLRSLGPNWSGYGNRREAGIALSFLTGYGHESSGLVSALSKTFKRTDPVRLLEAHMACLRQLYDDWIDNEPEDIDDDRPTEEQMTAFEDAEKAHHAQFGHLEQLASRLSQSLGVGKLDQKLTPALIGFVKEGIRFAFSTDDDDGLVLGSRLNFLFLVGKYLVWIKRDKTHRRELSNELQIREADLRAHPEFQDVHEDDLKALASIREALGLKVKSSLDQNAKERAVSPAEGTLEDYSERENDGNTTPSNSFLKSDLGSSTKRSSVSSAHSKLSSVRGSLSPLQEHRASEDSDDYSSVSSKKRGPETQTTYEGESQNTVEAGESNVTDDEESAVDNVFAGKVKRSKAY